MIERCFVSVLSCGCFANGKENKMLEIRNLKKSYDGVTILHDINLTIEDGEIVSILGPSGCGASVKIRLS